MLTKKYTSDNMWNELVIYDGVLIPDNFDYLLAISRHLWYTIYVLIIKEN